ncbi:hypothetical protein ABH931_000580 [Streptacidiphilus sp. MAP12-33]
MGAMHVAMRHSGRPGSMGTVIDLSGDLQQSQWAPLPLPQAARLFEEAEFRWWEAGGFAQGRGRPHRRPAGDSRPRSLNPARWRAFGWTYRALGRP